MNGKRNIALDFAILVRRLTPVDLDKCARKECTDEVVETLWFHHPNISEIGLCQLHLQEWIKESDPLAN